MKKRWMVMWVACLLLPAAIAVAGAETLVLTDAWVRALPPNQKVTAAYLSVSNSLDRRVTITRASAERAGAVEIHTVRRVDGYVRMKKLPHIHLPPNGSVRLAPGGTHLMLMQLESMPAPGETVNLCLQLASGNASCIRAPVRKSTPDTGRGNHQQHH